MAEFTLSDNRKTRKLIIDILETRYPLTVKDIFDEISKRNPKMTYQAVHKMCKSLVNEGILSEEESRYLINNDWVRGIADFANRVSARYGIKLNGTSLNSLSSLQKDQMIKKKVMPRNEEEVIFHLMEEVGELAESIREERPHEEVETEIADVLWQLNKICWGRDVNLEKAFIEKLEKNWKR